jgi:hypothetical protein
MIDDKCYIYKNADFIYEQVMQNLTTLNVDREHELKLMAEYIELNGVTICPVAKRPPRRVIEPFRGRKPMIPVATKVPRLLKEHLMNGTRKYSLHIRQMLRDLHELTEFNIPLDDLQDGDLDIAKYYSATLYMWEDVYNNVNKFCKRLEIERTATLVGQLVWYHVKRYQPEVYKKLLGEIKYESINGKPIRYRNKVCRAS